MKNTAIKQSISIRSGIDAKRKDSNLWGFEKWREIGERVITDMKKNGQFFNTEQGLFYFDSEHRSALPLLKGEVGLAAILNQRYGINPKEHGFGRVLHDLISEAYTNGRKIDIRRLAHYNSQTKCLYVSRFDGCVYRLNGNAVMEVKNGTDDVFFFDDNILWEPYRYIADVQPGEFDRQLIESVNFANSTLNTDEQRKLLKLWTVSVFFGSIQPTKIILLLLGEHGSGKTSALRRIQKFIFGQKADLLSIEKDKQDGFIATVTTDPIALFDNVDEQITWLPYALSRLATGVTFSKRVLYTTNQKVQFPGVSWLGITSRTVDFMAKQPDLPDRTLVLEMERLDNKKPEGELVLGVAKFRNEMWSELLDQLNTIVRHLHKPAQPIAVKFRMADFASFALQVSALWGCRGEVEAIFNKLEQAQANLVFDNEPIHLVLHLWLAIEANHGREVEAGTLYREWSTLATANQIGWPFADSRTLGRRVTQLRHALKQKFDFKLGWNSHMGQHRYCFWPKGTADEGHEAQRATATNPVPETAGNAG